MKILLLSRSATKGKVDYVSNDCGAWARVMDGDCFPIKRIPSMGSLSQFNDYDAIIVNSEGLDYRAIKRLKDELDVPLIGKTEIPIDWLQHRPAMQQIDYIREIKLFDAIATLDDNIHKQFYSQITDAPVFGFQPFAPLKYYRDSIIEPSEKNRNLISIGLFGISDDIARCGRGFIYTIMLFKMLKKKHPDLEPIILGMTQRNINTTKALLGAIGIRGITFAPEMPWSEYLKHLSETYFAINLTSNYTYGRFHIDCAGLGIPLISSGNSIVMRELFPDLIVNVFDLEEGCEQFDRHYNLESRYMAVRDNALEKVKKFDEKYHKERIEKVNHPPLKRVGMCPLVDQEV